MINKILNSSIRSSILIGLLNRKTRLKDLSDAATQNTNNSIRPLIEAGMVERLCEGEYRLTNRGRALTLIYQDILDAEEVLQADFWQGHDMSSIPDSLLRLIGMLKGGGIVHPNGDQMKAQRNFVDLVSNAKEIWGASSINAPGYEAMISEALRNGAEVNLILTRAVIDTIDPSQIHAWQCEAKFHLWKKEIRAAFTVADNVLLLGLFNTNGQIDPFQEYVCESEKARDWGKMLFDYYLSL